MTNVVSLRGGGSTPKPPADPPKQKTAVREILDQLIELEAEGEIKAIGIIYVGEELDADIAWGMSGNPGEIHSLVAGCAYLSKALAEENQVDD